MQYNVGYHLNPTTFVWEKGEGYTFKNFITSINNVIPQMDVQISRPSDLFFTICLVLLIVIYIVVIYLADNLFESNRGHPHNPFKFLTKLFSKSKKKEKKEVDSESEDEDESIPDSNDIPAKPILEISTLDKSYKLNLLGTSRFKALSDISLKIRKNEIISLLGENGAGKTTLISILTGLLEFEKGQVIISPSTKFYEANIHDINLKRQTVNEKDISKVAAELNQGSIDLIEQRDLCRNLISVCPQYDLLWLDLTVEENMRLVGLFKGISPKEIDSQIEMVLRKINLFKEKKNFVKNLSGGMKRRISIGLALLGNSEIIILDEPTTGLDPVNRKAIWEFIRELKKNGKTILLTTHIMDEADILSDRVAVINKGELLTVSDTVGIKSQFKLLNLIFAINCFSEEKYQLLITLLEANFGKENFQEKYKSETSIKFNIPILNKEDLKAFVKRLDIFTTEKVFSNVEVNGVKNSDYFIESYDLSSLDLEEAYMMLNEKHEKEKELNQE